MHNISENRVGQLFVISAPSGAGKTTLCNMLIKKHPNIAYSVSYTTRQPRGAEQNGVHYHFVSETTFKEMINNGDFIEYALVHGNFYGTSRKAVEQSLENGEDIIMDIDTQGAIQLMEKISYGAYIFIAPPSMNALRERLTKRNDTAAESLELRIKNSEKEMACIKRYTYLIINDKLEHAFNQLDAIYTAEKTKIAQIKDIDRLL